MEIYKYNKLYDHEKMKYLLSDGENLIWSEIHTYTDNTKKPAHSVEFIKYMIECFISLSNETGQPVDYSCIKDFFLFYDSDGEMEKEYNKFISSKSCVDERIESDKALFWINYMESNILSFIRKVLSDSETDPHYSAVYAANIIKCIIHLLKESGQKLAYSDIKEFFISNGFSLDEYDAFEASRKKESVYYRGIQY